MTIQDRTVTFEYGVLNTNTPRTIYWYLDGEGVQPDQFDTVIDGNAVVQPDATLQITVKATATILKNFRLYIHDSIDDSGDVVLISDLVTVVIPVITTPPPNDIKILLNGIYGNNRPDGIDGYFKSINFSGCGTFDDSYFYNFTTGVNNLWSLSPISRYDLVKNSSNPVTMAFKLLTESVQTGGTTLFDIDPSKVKLRFFVGSMNAGPRNLGFYQTPGASERSVCASYLAANTGYEINLPYIVNQDNIVEITVKSADYEFTAPQGDVSLQSFGVIYCFAYYNDHAILSPDFKIALACTKFTYSEFGFAPFTPVNKTCGNISVDEFTDFYHQYSGYQPVRMY